MPYQLDKSTWPVVRFKFIGRMSAADVDHYFEDGDALVNGGVRYVCLMDGTRMLVPEAEFVRRQALWIRDNREAMRQVNGGIAFVMPSALVRGLVRAVMYFQEMPVPHASFATLPEGLEWARARATNSV